MDVHGLDATTSATKDEMIINVVAALREPVGSSKEAIKWNPRGDQQNRYAEASVRPQDHVTNSLDKASIK